MALGLLLPSGARATTPFASTLNDICPGTPDPCVVTGKFLVTNGADFNLGNRVLHLTSTAALDAGGGSFTIENAASIALDKLSRLSSNAKGATAGTISIGSTGPCTLNGKIQANALADTINGLPGNGGTINVSCSDIALGQYAALEAKGAGVYVDGYPDGGHGGEISLTATTGAVTAGKGAGLNASGQGGDPISMENGGGGSITVTAATTCTLAGTLKADATGMRDPDIGPVGGVGGFVQITCADVTLNATGKITAGSARTSEAGEVRLEATTGSVTTEKGSKIVADGDTLAGGSRDWGIHVRADYGACSLSGSLQSKSGLYSGDVEGNEIGCASLTLSPSFTFDGSNTGGAAAWLGIFADGACNLAGDVNVKSASGRDAGTVVPGLGGDVNISCGGTITQTLDSSLDASASGGGNDVDGYPTAGSVEVHSGGAVTLGGKLVASSATGGQGSVVVTAIGVTTTTNSKLEAKGPMGFVTIFSGDVNTATVAGDVSIGKLVSASGGTVNVEGGCKSVLDPSCNTVDIEGCNVTVGPSAELTTTGRVGGVTSLVAHEVLTINGKVSALSSTVANPAGTNVLKYRDTYFVLDPTKIKPATTPEQDLTLSVCP